MMDENLEQLASAYALRIVAPRSLDIVTPAEEGLMQILQTAFLAGAAAATKANEHAMPHGPEPTP